MTWKLDCEAACHPHKNSMSYRPLCRMKHVMQVKLKADAAEPYMFYYHLIEEFIQMHQIVMSALVEKLLHFVAY
jgi:hypothetical protein